MGRGKIKDKFTATRRINFLIGWFQNMSTLLADMLEQSGPETASITALLRSQIAFSMGMLDLRDEKYQIIELPGGAKVAYFEWCGLQVPVEELAALMDSGDALPIFDEGGVK